MFKKFLEIATGRSIYGVYFLLLFMIVAPSAVFTDYVWLDSLAWAMTIILGFFIFVTGIVTWQEGKESYRWPQANAKLISTGLKQYRGSKGGVSYAPKINCKFMVDGIRYSGTEYDFSGSYSAKAKAEKKTAEIENLNTLLVHYKPDDPSINVIYPGIHFVVYLRLLLGIGAMFISALSWLGYIRY